MAIEILRMCSSIQTFQDIKHKRLSIPIFVQYGGDPDASDGIVDTSVTRQFCKSSIVDGSCTIKGYPLAKHAIWQEVDAVRDEAMYDVSNFFEMHADKVVGPPTTNVRERSCNRDSDCTSEKFCDQRLPIGNDKGTCRKKFDDGRNCVRSTQCAGKSRCCCDDPGLFYICKRSRICASGPVSSITNKCLAK